jgi:hypothetical protein
MTVMRRPEGAELVDVHSMPAWRLSFTILIVWGAHSKLASSFAAIGPSTLDGLWHRQGATE